MAPPTPTESYPDILTLLEYPHPVLRKAATPVTTFDDALAAFIQRMYDAMTKLHGVGLAAPQVGVSQRIFVTNAPNPRQEDNDQEDQGRPDDDFRVWINPRIENGGGSTLYEEGCLSFPGIYANVERFNHFDVVFQDTTGEEHRLHFDHQAGDFLAVVAQHEFDHLDGKLFVDHLSPLQMGQVRKKLKELEKNYKNETGKPGAVLRR